MTKHFILRLSQPSCLLNHLGAYSRLDSLLELPEMAAVDAASVRQSRSEEPYLVHLDTHGLSLTLQCTNPAASPQELLWGLQGLHVNALQCKILDSDGHRAREMTSDGVLQLFGIHSGDES